MKFFKKQQNSGFTLVELIVVIAILAILAGVGAVAYSGYIEYAKKGVDRKTVGEIMNAIELADYANPNLFGENGGAMIVISTQKTQVAGLNDENTGALKSALEDALGDLESTKLTYDKWAGTANMKVFAGLGREDTQVGQYLKNIKEGAKPTAFAEDFAEYWEIFEGLVNGMNDGSLIGGDKGINIEGDIKGQIVDKVVSTYNKEGGNDFTSVIETWKDKNKDFAGGDQGFGIGGRDLHLARNYAFISYAKRQNLSEEMKAELEEFEKNHKFDTITIITNELTGEDWQTIIDEYYKSQAESDARAYLGLMEAAGQVQQNLKATGKKYTDEDFLDALTPYVGMVSNILTGKTDLDNIKKLADSATGSVVIINVTKKDGVLRLEVSPDEANPRDESVVEVVNYTEPNTKIDFTGEGSITSTQTVVIKPNGSVTVSVGKSINLTDYSLDQELTSAGLKGSISGSNITITSTSDSQLKGGKLVFSKESKLTNTKTTITINVDVIG